MLASRVFIEQHNQAAGRSVPEWPGGPEVKIGDAPRVVEKMTELRSCGTRYRWTNSLGDG